MVGADPSSAGTYPTLKSSGGACPWCKTLWNRRDPSHCPLRGGQVYEIQAHVSRQKDLIGI